MYFTEQEKYVLAMLASGMLQAGEQEGLNSRRQWDHYLRNACRKLGTDTSIILRKYDVNPFQTIKIWGMIKNNLRKTSCWK